MAGVVDSVAAPTSPRSGLVTPSSGNPSTFTYVACEVGRGTQDEIFANLLIWETRTKLFLDRYVVSNTPGGCRHNK